MIKILGISFPIKGIDTPQLINICEKKTPNTTFLVYRHNSLLFCRMLENGNLAEKKAQKYPNFNFRPIKIFKFYKYYIVHILNYLYFSYVVDSSYILLSL